MTIQNSDIRRAFVTLTEGQLHLRRLDPAMPGDQTKIPLLMLHASPSSSWSLQGIMTALHGAGSRAPLIAPDTLGNGDSDKPDRDRHPQFAHPSIADYAPVVLEAVDDLGIGEARRGPHRVALGGGIGHRAELVATPHPDLRRTRSLMGVGPRSKCSRMQRSRYRR